MNNLLDNNKEIVLPSSQSDLKLANEFREFFNEKINKIRSSIKRPPQEVSTKKHPMSKFEPDELRQTSREPVKKGLSMRSQCCCGDTKECLNIQANLSAN